MIRFTNLRRIQLEANMWQEIDEATRNEMARDAATRNPAVSIVGLILCIVTFIVCFMLGMSPIFPGEYSLKPYPSWNTVWDTMVGILPYCLGITASLFLGTYLWYRFKNKSKRIQEEYNNMFSSKMRLCPNCDHVYEEGTEFCPSCKEETKNINEYIWIDQ